MGAGWVAVLWLLTRGLVVVLLLGPHAWVNGDLVYFAESLSGAGDRGLAHTLVEYPLPGVALLAFPWLVVEWVARPDLYAEAVLVLALVTDALFTGCLRRFGGGCSGDALGMWLLAVPLLGATTYARFDLVPGVLAALAVLVLPRHPRVAAFAVAVATGLKLWPALLLPALAARATSRWAVVGAAAVVGGLMALAVLVLAGPGRLVSPLTWQSERGLQIESVPATPAMLAWSAGGGELSVGYSDYNAFQVAGPGVGTLITGAGVLSVLLVVSLGWAWLRAWRAGDTLRRDAVVWLCLSAVLAFMVSSKVLSPQYLLWLLPVTAAGLAVMETARGRRRLRLWAGLALVATGATQLVFPLSYGGLTVLGPESGAAVLVLVVRNLVLVVLLVLAAWEAWWHLVRGPGAQRGMPLERQPPGPAGSHLRTLR